LLLEGAINHLELNIPKSRVIECNSRVPEVKISFVFSVGN